VALKKTALAGPFYKERSTRATHFRGAITLVDWGKYKKKKKRERQVKKEGVLGDAVRGKRRSGDLYKLGENFQLR